MAIRTRSLQHEYDEFWTGDEAFQQPPKEPDVSREKNPPAWEAHDKALAEWQRRVRVARETGNWEALRIDGAPDPTRFVLKPIPGNLFRKLVDDVTNGAIGGTEAMTLMLQLALVDVVNLEGVKDVGRTKHPRYGDMATVQVPNLLDKIDPTIVGELGSAIRDRAQGVLPLL